MDLAAAPPLLGDAAFHCQQAIEKAMKGFLAWHDQAFRRTHDLGELGAACVRIEPALEPVLSRVAPLTEYAWRYRYPGEPFAPPEAEIRAALALASEAIAALIDRLPRVAHP